MPRSQLRSVPAVRRLAALVVALALVVLAPAAGVGAVGAGHGKAGPPGGGRAGTPAIDGTFPLTAQPEQITAGPDGNMWVSLSGTTDDLAKVTPAGAITYYDLGGASGLGALTVGPDGNLWATISTGVVKIPPANPTNETSFPIGGFIDARGIDLGPDGNLWAASGDKVYRIPAANPAGFTAFTVAGIR